LFPNVAEEPHRPGDNIEDPVIIIDSDEDWFTIINYFVSL
jgi:hypothetical protein